MRFTSAFAAEIKEDGTSGDHSLGVWQLLICADWAKTGEERLKTPAESVKIVLLENLAPYGSIWD